MTNEKRTRKSNLPSKGQRRIAWITASLLLTFFCCVNNCEAQTAICGKLNTSQTAVAERLHRYHPPGLEVIALCRTRGICCTILCCDLLFPAGHFSGAFTKSLNFSFGPWQFAFFVSKFIFFCFCTDEHLQWRRQDSWTRITFQCCGLWEPWDPDLTSKLKYDLGTSNVYISSQISCT